MYFSKNPTHFPVIYVYLNKHKLWDIIINIFIFVFYCPLNLLFSQQALFHTNSF